MYRVCGLLVLTLVLVSDAGGQPGDKPQPKKPLPPAVEKLLKLSPEQFIQRFDKNKDGMLSRDELPRFMGKAFERFDANNDGKLERAEVTRMLQGLRVFFGLQQPAAKGGAQVEALVNKLLARFDTDKDGKISKAEAMGRLADAFAQIDTNKDGLLDRQELRVLATRLLANQKGGGFKGAGPRLDFDALDRNADGRLTRAEVRGSPLEKLFDQIDTNRDGRISREEFEAYLEKSESKKQ